MRDPGKGGALAKSRQRGKISLVLCLFVFFSFFFELISALLISGWYSAWPSSPRGREEEENKGSRGRE